MIDHIEVITEGFELMDKTVRLLKPLGHKQYEGRVATITGKYAHSEHYYVTLKSGTVIVIEKGDFIVL